MIDALSAPLVLTDGGIETRIVYEFKRPIADFNASLLLEDDEGRAILRSIYASYADVARRYRLPIQLGTPTWRAGLQWIGARNGDDVNLAAVAFLREVATASGATVVLTGDIGPSHDGYDPRAGLGEDDAYRYHRRQARALALGGVDLLFAPTFPAIEELCGAARAMAETGTPYALAPMLTPQGTMLDGTPLEDAIARIDASVFPVPHHYAVVCLYPTLASQALAVTRERNAGVLHRVTSLKANASPLSPEELDKLDRLATTPPDTFARDLWSCAREFGLTILGGCCGTGANDIEAIAAMRAAA